MAAVSFVALHDHGGAKVTKSRTRSSVKPILRKLHSSSCSEKNSLDLDRGWDEQTSPHLGHGAPTLDDYYYGSYHGYNSYNSASTTTTANTGTSSTAATTPADLSGGGGPSGTLLSSSSTIILPASPLATPALTQASSASTSIDSPATAASHIRSTSGASQFSIAASTASAGSPRHVHGGGSFVHPFQQTPRTSTPPLLSYAHARASLDTLSIHGSSHGSGSHANSSHNTATAAAAPARDAPTTIDEKDEELEPLPRPLVTSATATSLRPSLDMHHFRLRARSDVDTATRQEQVRAARRKFEEKERAKQEKYAREQTRKQQQQHSVHHHKSRKGSWPTRSSTSEARPAGGAAPARRSTAHEKTELEASNGLFSHERAEDDAAQQTDARPATARASASQGPVDMSDVHFAHSTRRRDAKRKTTGAWTAFVLWFRTRLLKLGRRWDRALG